MSKEALNVSPQVGPEASPARIRNQRLKLLAILLLCALPVIASYITYYFVRPEGRRNNGDIIDPQVPTPALLAKTLEGQTFNLQTLKGQWVLLSVSGGACNETCQRNLYLQRQLRESLGRDKDRMDWLWIVSDEAPVSESLLATLRGAIVLRLPRAQISQWLRPAPGQSLESHLYMVDPIGNWMMRFKPGMDAQDARKAKSDMERLMRASSFWDKAGRPESGR